MRTTKPFFCDCYIFEEDGHKGRRPVFKTEGAACADVALPRETTIQPGEVIKADLLIMFDIPKGYVVRMYPRSSLLVKFGVMSPTTNIDWDYKGHVHVPLINLSDKPVTFMEGERIAQVECVKCGPRPDNWIQETNKRDQNGFGGSGRV